MLLENAGLLVAAMILQGGALAGDMLAPDRAHDARPLTEIATGCVTFPNVTVGKDDFDLADCLPVASGTVGHVDHRWYHYVFYCLSVNRDQRKCEKSDVPRGVAIFVSDDDSAFVRLLLARTAGFYWDSVITPPQLITNSFGTFLQVNVDGWRSNESDYYLWRPAQQAWRRIDFNGDRLKARLDDRVPPGMEWNPCAMYPNLSSMMTETYFKRPNDAWCSGRITVDIRMTIRNGLFDVEYADIKGRGRVRPKFSGR